jgi:polyhydroxybutyrate depolymerase
MPLVLVLHGALQTPQGIERLSRMSEQADASGFVAVYPRGTGRLPTWNAGRCCGSAKRDDVDDVGFLSALVEEVAGRVPIDRRVYATGLSNGGMMSYRLACERSDLFAAIAPVEGAMDLDLASCAPERAVSVLVLHGTADSQVPFAGGTHRGRLGFGDVRYDTPVSEAVRFWVDKNGCPRAPQRREDEPLTSDLYGPCRENSEVVLHAIAGGRHGWPGAFSSGSDVAASKLIWSFFARHGQR